MALKHWVWLAARPGIIPRKAVELIERFGDPEKIFYAREAELLETGLVSQKEAAPFCDKDMEKPRRILKACDELGCSIITIGDAAYPERLRNIYDPPILLYVLGRLPAVDEEAAIAIVGTRSCTPYGVKTAERMGYEITRGGGLVVSGLARGVDSAAARGALRAGGRVVGVLGTAIDRVYPRENASLFDDVKATGAIISEYAPGEQAPSNSFPMRNRIMSGISAGVVVIEAPAVSGALITASRALEQGRDVFVVPGNVDAAACVGSNNLLREGAAAVMSGSDVLSEYIVRFPEKLALAGDKELVPLDGRETEKLIKKEVKVASNRQKTPKKEIDNVKNVDYIDLVIERGSLSLDEQSIVDKLSKADMYVDDIAAESGLPVQAVLSALTFLEVEGVVERRNGNLFTLKAVVK